MSKRRYYSVQEVAQHCSKADCWVSLFGKVIDLTNLIKHHDGTLVLPLVRFAGEDISHWFDPNTKEPKTHLDLNTGKTAAYTPFGRFVHIPAPEDYGNPAAHTPLPWWRDDSLVVGHLSKKVRSLRLINTLTGQEDVIQVCAEETLADIRERYTAFNRNSKGYKWRKLGRELNMNATLEENGIADDEEEIERLLQSTLPSTLLSAAGSNAPKSTGELELAARGLTDPSSFIPGIHLYYFIDDSD